MRYKSVVCVYNYTLYHLYPLPRSLWFKEICLLLVCYSKNLALKCYRSVLFQQNLSLFLPCFSAVVNKFGCRVKYHHTLLKVSKKHFLINNPRKNYFLFVFVSWISLKIPLSFLLFNLDIYIIF
jgi:hypothetical protein